MTEAELTALRRVHVRRLGRLEQVRRSTRVRCVYCCGRRSGCPMCDGGFMSRDEAIAYSWDELEVLEK